MSKVAVIGGGASGMVAAIAAARSGSEVTIYEGLERVGNKILSTGNGRCNLTNIYADINDYHGENVEFINGVKSQFWVDESIDFFNALGVLTKVEEEGKVYPYTNQAASVLDALRFELSRLNVRIIERFEVCDIIKKKNGFMLTAYDGRRERVEAVVMATGGKAAPATGSKGGGYALLEKFGHTKTELLPSLVQIKTSENIVKRMKGIKLDAKLTLGDITRQGELLFTEYGLSGPPIFFLSAYLDKSKDIYVDIMPEYTLEEVKSILFERKKTMPNITLENFFMGILNKRVGQSIMKQLDIAPLSRTADSLSDSDLICLAQTIKSWHFIAEGTMSWNNAQVTKGGIRTDEFDEKTLQSKLIPGIFAAGEILDIDGNCGGFNLQWAWASGYISGKNAAAFEW